MLSLLDGECLQPDAVSFSAGLSYPMALFKGCAIFFRVEFSTSKDSRL